MTIDPATLPPGTVVEVERPGVFTSLRYATGDADGCTTVLPGSMDHIHGDKIVRTFSPDPLPSQEVPRDEWPNVKPGSRVRMEDVTGGVHEFTATDVGQLYIQSEINLWRHTRDIARVFVLDEPADPDADLIEKVARHLADAEGFVWPESDDAREVWRKGARAALAAVREAGA